MARNTLDYIKLGLLLSIICVIAAGSLAVIYSITKQRIEIQRKREIQESLPLVLPDAQTFSDQKQLEDINYYEGYDNDGSLIGYALNGSAQGYQSTIKFIIGIDPQGTIKGLRILEQGETPGLGARITEMKSDQSFWSFIGSVFNGKEQPTESLVIEPWFTEMFRGKDYQTLTVSKTGRTATAVEAITGATITSEAVADGVKDTIATFLEKVR